MGLFTPIYMKEKLNARQVRTAISKVEKMTDQAKLTAVALEGKDKSVRSAAVGRLEDANLVADLALSDPSVEDAAFEQLKKLCDQNALVKVLTRHPSPDFGFILGAIKLIRDQSALERIAQTAASDKAREYAVEKLENQSVLNDIALNSPIAAQRIRAAMKLTDPAVLAKLALDDGNASVRECAIDNPNMTDAAALSKAALEDPDRKVRKAAIKHKHMTDSHALAQIALQDESAAIRNLAAENEHLNDLADLKLILQKSKDEDIREQAVRRLEDAATLARVALKGKTIMERTYAIRNPHLTDQAALAKVAIGDEVGNIRCECIRDRVTDPEMLALVARESKYADSRICAVEHAGFTDVALLKKIALEDGDDDVRVAAIMSKNMTDPDFLEKTATAPGDGASLRVRLKAALKLSGIDPVRSVAPLAALINECRTSGTDDYRVHLLCKDAAAFLMKQYRATDDPAIRGVIATVPNGRYGHGFIDSGDCNKHNDDSVHFDIPR